MSLIAVVDIANPDLALMPTIRDVSDVSVQVLPHSGTDPDTGRFAFFVEGEAAALDRFEAALAGDHTVAAFETISRSEEGAIYHLTHTDEAKLISPTTLEAGGMVREAKSTDRRWRMHLQFPDREALATLWEYCDEEDISFEVRRLYRQDGWAIGEATDLTDAQRAALLTAYRNGYFDEPRETSLEELAEELGISPTAVGGRIRRGVAALVETSLVEE
jgi:hypothetical protein